MLITVSVFVKLVEAYGLQFLKLLENHLTLHHSLTHIEETNWEKCMNMQISGYFLQGKNEYHDDLQVFFQRVKSYFL